MAGLIFREDERGVGVRVDCRRSIRRKFYRFVENVNLWVIIFSRKLTPNFLPSSPLRLWYLWDLEGALTSPSDWRRGKGMQMTENESFSFFRLELCHANTRWSLFYCGGKNSNCARSTFKERSIAKINGLLSRKVRRPTRKCLFKIIWNYSPESCVSSNQQVFYWLLSNFKIFDVYWNQNGTSICNFVVLWDWESIVLDTITTR